MSRRILLAGGAGFIGSHLTDALLERGDAVVILDNLATGQRKNLVGALANPRCSIVEHDITQPLPTRGPMVERFDMVFDFASPASPSDFLTMPREILAVGSVGTSNLIDRALADSALFFLASTSEVYGDPLVHPQPETYWGNVSSIGPRSCYDEAKRFSEALTMANQRTRGLNSRIVRIFNTYGERMRPDDGRVVSTFIRQALAGEALTLYGDGSQSRSFCYISDLVRGLIAITEQEDQLPINLGNPAECTMRELAETVVDLVAAPSEIVNVPMPPEREGDPLQRCPDIQRATSLLRWVPTVSLREGLGRMIEHYRELEANA
ncbi:MAG: NAD-dependent epimerase/dehydratase family protein [Candidatus Limnocylindrus sp.]